MKKSFAVIAMSLFSLMLAQAQDPVTADPKHYKVILDTPEVRVLDIHVAPGEKTAMHSHPRFVLYAFTDSTIKFSTPDGKTNTATMKAGEARYSEGLTHAGENVGTAELHVLNIELKK